MSSEHSDLLYCELFHINIAAIDLLSNTNEVTDLVILALLVYKTFRCRRSSYFWVITRLQYRLFNFIWGTKLSNKGFLHLFILRWYNAKQDFCSVCHLGALKLIPQSFCIHWGTIGSGSNPDGNAIEIWSVAYKGISP